MQETLSCRGCRRVLTEDAGCALCLPIKPHLIVSASVDEDDVPLATVATEAVGLLRRQLTHVKSATKAIADHSSDVAIELRGEARSIANTLAKLLDSARKVVQDGADAVDAMSFQEKAQLFLEWTASLPAIYRRKLITELMGQQGKTQDETQPEDASVQ